MKSPLAYIGGKSKLSSQIIEMLPEHQAYSEVFSGAAWVFFRKEPVKAEVLNDLDSELVTFYRVVQYHLEEFLRQFKWMITSREWFEDWQRQQDAGGLTDIQQAARYYYVQRLAFGGRVRGRTFGAAPMDRPRINLLRLEEEMSEVHMRLAQVTVENLPALDFLKRYDRPAMLFYLDPPYFKAPHYKHNLDLPDYLELADALAGLKGRFLLSINDRPEMREAFKIFDINPVQLKYSVAKEGLTKAKELLIKNY